jgi:5S rRNA maturation endonuclease (ribonuclease M5)
MIAKDDKIKEYGFFLNAPINSYANTINRIKGCYQWKNIIILIDGGSTHSFINAQVLEEVNEIIKKKPLY